MRNQPKRRYSVGDVDPLSGLSRTEFETLLEAAATALRSQAADQPYKASRPFEHAVREAISRAAMGRGLSIDFDPADQAFPDIVVGRYGVEVKFTVQDTWRCIANSVFEGTRSAAVELVYLVYGKMGGTPDVRWGHYGRCVMHVRTSHVPRFEVQMYPDQSLFDKLGISYEDFAGAPLHEKMKHIREYARGRLRRGERLWWLEDRLDQPHTLPLEVRLYMRLPQDEKRRLRAEAALLCPQIVKPSRTRDKYHDAVMYLLTYHGVLCPQARDLFSAGSVAMRADLTRGGNYVERALRDIEAEMLSAAQYMEDALFVEYWGVSVPPARRIEEWLKRADTLAVGWLPSTVLFGGHQGDRPGRP